jgi:hypothetical protein
LLAAKGGSSMDSPCNSSFTSSALALFLYLWNTVRWKIYEHVLNKNYGGQKVR